MSFFFFLILFFFFFFNDTATTEIYTLSLHDALPDLAKLDYDLSTFLGFEYPEPCSCIIHQVNEDKDLHEEMGGFPKTYQFENTIIRQKWWTEEEHDFEAIGNSLGMDVVTLSSILQPPGSTVPWHHDQFFLLKKKFPDRPQPVRALMMLKIGKHTSELQSHSDLVCRLLLEKKKTNRK